MVVTIKSQADLNKVLKMSDSKLVVIDFYATWCGPCKDIAPHLAALQRIYSNVVIVKVDVDKCEKIAMDYRVSGMPTFCFIKKGRVVSRFSGADTKKLKTTIENFSY